jgi:ATP-dependent RNA helicase RhlE
LPILQRLAIDKRERQRGMPRVLILAPTRELAAQIGDGIAAYGRYLKIYHAVVFGGVGQGKQVLALERGVDILVATPGRLLDLKEQGFVSFKNIDVFVLDEADRMLDMGFINDIRQVIAALPAKRQSLFFSATMVPEVRRLAQSLVSDPVQVTIDPEKPAVDRIAQKVYFVDDKKKQDLLVKLLNGTNWDKVIIFVQMKHMADRVVERLAKHGISAYAIHGNKSQGAREAALGSFKSGKTRVLVATDIAARGIDVKDISHVVNYQIPIEAETYVHRIGRTARAGKDGDAYSFCCASERDAWRRIEKLINKTVEMVQDPEFHSEAARTATGEAARPAPKVPHQRSTETRMFPRPYQRRRS